MNCPNCGAELIAGEATVRGTILGFLAVGLSHQHLFFKQSDTSNGTRSYKKKVLPSGNITRADHCGKCGLTVIQKAKTVW